VSGRIQSLSRHPCSPKWTRLSYWLGWGDWCYPGQNDRIFTIISASQLQLGVIVKTFYCGSTSRWSEISTGIVCVAIGLFLGIPGIGLGFELVRGHTDAEPLLVVLLVMLSFFFLVVGIRLVTGRRRSGGGLLSPLMLRVCGFFFLAAPVWILLESKDWKAFHLLGLIGTGIACFSLANHRIEERLAGSSNDT